MPPAAAPQSEPVSLRRALQTHTYDIHQALHRHPALAPLQDPHITRDQYAKIIAGFFSFYTEQEPRYAIHAGQFAGEVRPLELLRRDAAILSLNAPVSAPSRAAADEADYVAYLYVKQGSTLGGQLIAKHLHRTLGLTGGQDMFFFYGDGGDTGKNWKAFEAWLEAAETRIDHDRVLTNAQKIFQSLYDHLSGEMA